MELWGDLISFSIFCVFLFDREKYVNFEPYKLHVLLVSDKLHANKLIGQTFFGKLLESYRSWLIPFTCQRSSVEYNVFTSCTPTKLIPG